METYIIAAVFMSLSVFSVFFYVYTTLQKKEEHYLTQITGEKDYKSGLSDIFVKLITPGNDRLKETQTYLSTMEYEVTAQKIFIVGFFSAIAFCVIYFLMVYYFTGFLLAAFAAVVGAVFGYKIPEIILKSKFKDFQVRRQTGVLSFLEMLQVACEAGLTLNIAIDRIYQYYPSPLALEFKRANSEYLGNLKSRREAYENIVRRVGGEDIRTLVEEILQAFETGSPIREVLGSLAKEIRRDKRKEIKIKAQANKWKNFLISIVFQLPPYIFILIGPSFYELMKSLG